MAVKNPIDSKETPGPQPPTTPQPVVYQNMLGTQTVQSQTPQIFSYPTGSILDLAYGANDPSLMASQILQGGQLFRLSRGFPYKRNGHMVPVFPQFKSQPIHINNLASQPQANSSAAQITAPTADPTTTNNNQGTPVINYPGFVELNLT